MCGPLPEEGWHAPLVGGSFLVLFGLLLAASYTIQWALLTGAMDDWGGSAFGWLWLGYGVIAISGVVWLAKRVRRKPGVSSLINKVDLCRVANRRLGHRRFGGGLHHPHEFGRRLSSLRCDHGSGVRTVWRAAGCDGGDIRISDGCIGIRSCRSRCRSCFDFPVSAWAYLAAAAASLIVLALPGFIMLRREPSAVV